MSIVLLLSVLKWLALAVGALGIVSILILIGFLWFDAMVDRVVEREKNL